MKKFSFLLLIIFLGTLISLVFSFLPLQNEFIPHSLKLIIVTIGVGTVCLGASGLISLLIYKQNSLDREYIYLLFILLSGLIGLTLVIFVSETQKISNIAMHPWWLIVNLSVGLIFISIGFTVVFLVQRFQEQFYKSQTLSELLNSFKKITITDLQKDLIKLNNIRNKIIDTFENQKREIEQIEKEFDKIEEERKKIYTAFKELYKRESRKNFIIQLILLFMGIILGTYATLIVTR